MKRMSTPQLLMIEDDARLAQMVGEYLTQSGFAFNHAGDGASGLEQLLQHAPDLVILDLMLPDADGLEVCRRIRALPGPMSKVSVLMLTAKGDPMDRIIGLEIGADDYLPKPFEPRELLARIRAVLRRRGETTSEAEGPAVMRFGFLASTSMAARIRPMCTSMERSKASSSRPRTASMIWSRVSTRPARSAMATSRSNW